MLKKSLGLYFFCLLLITCSSASKVNFSVFNIPSSSTNIVEVNIPLAQGNDSISRNINFAIEKTIIESLKFGDTDLDSVATIDQAILNFNNEYNHFFTDFPESVQVWEAQYDGEVAYQSPELICIAITSYTNTGGAHGDLKIKFMNFNGQTGRVFSNADLFNDLVSFKKLAYKHFTENIADEAVSIFENEEFRLPQNITYSSEGIVLLYNTYEIAPYSSGIIDFTIPFEDVDSYLVFDSL